ncbi:uncharacterized protein LOC132624578 [Lycium barbarum]|uniref:uncharacterized protein LOC132624578 n=1 Tax=Lycium barbarum TaxID=112863 RepID=UPI00293E69A7|nr:uncharacterized protein LOC132624578 [Lycium barbarum]
MSESTSHDAPPVSSPGAKPATPVKFEPTVWDIIPAKFNFNKDLEVEKPSSVSDRGFDPMGLPKGSVATRSESGTAPPASAPEFDTAGSSRVLSEAAKRKRPSKKMQTPKRKKARSVARPSREETEPDIIVRRVGSVPTVASILEEAVSIPPLPSIDEGLLIPAPRSGAEEMLSPALLGSIDFVDISGETSSEDAPLQRKTPGEAIAVEADKGVAPVPESEAPTGARPSPEHEPATIVEPSAFAENIEAAPSSSTPVLRSVVLVNEAFIRAQHKIDDLRGHLDAQGRETEKYRHLLQEKEEELNRAAVLANLRPELDAAKDENRRLKSELAAMTDYNRSLEAEKIGLSRDKAQFSSRLDELETTVSRLRGELDSVNADATTLTERNRRLESEAALSDERMRVFEEKAEERSRVCQGLRTELEEAAIANNSLKAELDAATAVDLF